MMEVALAVLTVLVVVLATALVRSQRRSSHRDHPDKATAASGLGRALTAPSREVQPADPGKTSPSEFLLEDESGRQLFAELIDPSESALWHRADTVLTHQSSSVALDKVLDAIPVIGVAVMGGKWVRILNPEALALGDQLKSKSGGFLGAVYGEKSIAAQLRFSKPQDLAELATPLVVFKVASMVTGQYYLNRINSQLMTIEGQVRQIRQDLRNETYGEITSAAEACIELEEGLSLSLDLTADERTRLVHAERDIDKAYKHKLKDVQDFLDDVNQLFAADTLDVSEADRLLREADSTRMYDMQLLAYGAAVRHKLNLLRAQLDLDAEGGRGELAQRKLDRELNEMRQDLAAAAEALAALGVNRDEASASWKMTRWTRPPKFLDTFHPRARAMRDLLIEAPRTLLLTPTPTPIVIEAYVDERGLVQVLSATPEAEPEPAALVSGPPLVSAPAPAVDRKQLRLKVLKNRRHEFEETGATNSLAAVTDQVAELEAEIAAPRGRGEHD